MSCSNATEHFFNVLANRLLANIKYVRLSLERGKYIPKNQNTLSIFHGLNKNILFQINPAEVETGISNSILSSLLSLLILLLLLLLSQVFSLKAIQLKHVWRPGDTLSQAVKQPYIVCFLTEHVFKEVQWVI